MEEEQVKYYYLRDNRDSNKPMVTVCLLKNKDGVISRGISVCSQFDNPNKKVGRSIALSRARKANGTKRNHEKSFTSMFLSNKKATMSVIDYYCALYGMESAINYFYEYNPTLTDLEKKIWKI